MRTIAFRAAVGFVAVGAVSGISGRAFAQDTPIPPASPPADESNRPNDHSVAALAPDTDSLLKILRADRNSIERLRKSQPTANQIQPVQKREDGEKELPVPSLDDKAASPTAAELLDLIQRQPGGADAVQRMKKAKADRQVVGMGAGIGLLPHHYLRSTNFSAPSFATTLRATLSNPRPTLSGFGSIGVTDRWIKWRQTSIQAWGPYERFIGPHQAVGDVSVKPMVNIEVTVSRSDYYILNVQATPTGAQLRRYSPTGVVTVQSFSNLGTGQMSYPVLLNLAAGTHHFYFLPGVPNGTGYDYVYEVSLSSVP